MSAQKAADKKAGEQKKVQVDERFLRGPRDDNVFNRLFRRMARKIETLEKAKEPPTPLPRRKAAASKEEAAKDDYGDMLETAIAHDGARIRYYDDPAKNPLSDIPLVFLSGWLCDPKIVWKEQVRVYGEWFRIIRPFYRGYFYSEMGKSDAETYIPDNARDLGAIFYKAGAKKAILVTHSMGGLVGIKHYVEYGKDIVKGLALINVPYGNPLKSLPVNLQMFKPLVEAGSFGLLQIPFIDKLKQTWLVKNPLAKRIIYRVITGEGRKDPKNEIGDKLPELIERATKIPLYVNLMASSSMMRMDLEPLLKKICVPTFILSGTRDRAVDSRHGEAMAYSIVSGEGGVEPNRVPMPCGHMPMMGFPKKFNQMLEKEFLAKLPMFEESAGMRKLHKKIQKEVSEEEEVLPYKVEHWRAYR